MAVPSSTALLVENQKKYISSYKAETKNKVCFRNPYFIFLLTSSPPSLLSQSLYFRSAVKLLQTSPHLTAFQQMRIRKNASKLLGSPFYLPSSSSDFAHNEVEKHTGIICELNSNPRDSLEFDDSIYYNNVANLKEEDDDGGILGNSIILPDVVEPISICLEETLPSITKYDFASTTEATSVKKKRGRKKKNNNEVVEKETYDTNFNNSKYCKKTDGKGWYCKREVEPPNTLCSYHIAQLRAYTTSHSLTKSTCIATEKVAMVDESSSLYYYYDGFGPCNGKRRDKLEPEVVVVSEKFDDDGGGRGGGENNKAIIAGDDEYDNDVPGFEKNGDENDGEYCEGEKKNVREMEVLEEKKKKIYKKRGRKPIKARSLKSIL